MSIDSITGKSTIAALQEERDISRKLTERILAYGKEIDRLRVVNADMLHELERLTGLVGEVDYDILMAVIAKAKGES